MKAYQSLWVAVCAPLTMVGLCLGFVLVPIPATVLAIVFGAVAALVPWVLLLQSEDAKGPPRVRARAIANNAAVVGAATGVVGGFAFLSGAGTLLLLILVLASSPYAVSFYGRWRLSETEHPCVSMRGVHAAKTHTVTSTLLGTQRTDPSSRAEFLSLAHGRQWC